MPVATTPEQFTARTASAATSTAAASYTWGGGGWGGVRGGGGAGWLDGAFAAVGVTLLGLSRPPARYISFRILSPLKIQVPGLAPSPHPKADSREAGRELGGSWEGPLT